MKIIYFFLQGKANPYFIHMISIYLPAPVFLSWVKSGSLNITKIMFDIKIIVCLFYVEKMRNDVQGMLVFRKWEIIYSPKFLKSIWYKLSWPLSQAWVPKHLWGIWQETALEKEKFFTEFQMCFQPQYQEKKWISWIHPADTLDEMFFFFSWKQEHNQIQTLRRKF